MGQRMEKRIKQDIHYAKGLRSGLPHTHHDQMKYEREDSDQNLRDNISMEAKEHYDKHHSLNRSFPKEKSRMKHVFGRKSQEKGMDKDR